MGQTVELSPGVRCLAGGCRLSRSGSPLLSRAPPTPYEGPSERPSNIPPLSDPASPDRLGHTKVIRAGRKQQSEREDTGSTGDGAGQLRLSALPSRSSVKSAQSRHLEKPQDMMEVVHIRLLINLETFLAIIILLLCGRPITPCTVDILELLLVPI